MDGACNKDGLMSVLPTLPWSLFGDSVVSSSCYYVPVFVVGFQQCLETCNFLLYPNLHRNRLPAHGRYVSDGEKSI
jgi:hypothetical protein